MNTQRLVLTSVATLGLVAAGLVLGQRDAEAQSTRRSALYFFTETYKDIFSANAHDSRVPEDSDTGEMEYTLVVDGPMIAQLAEAHFQGGSVQIQFTVREAFSFVGA